MKRSDNPLYFEHLCGVIRAVLSAESNLYSKGVFTKENVKTMSIEDYCGAIADELLSKTKKEELADF